MRNCVEIDQETMRRYYGQDVNEAPIMSFPSQTINRLLDEPVSIFEGRAVTFGEFISINLTAVSVNLDVIPKVSTEVFSQPNQLSQSALKQLALTRIDQGLEGNRRPAVLGSSYKDKLKQGISKNSELGRQHLTAIQVGLQLKVDLIAVGKFRLEEK